MSVERQARAGKAASAEPAFAFCVGSIPRPQDPRFRCVSAGVRTASALRGRARAGGRGAPGRRRRSASALSAVLRAVSPVLRAGFPALCTRFQLPARDPRPSAPPPRSRCSDPGLSAPNSRALAPRPPLPLACPWAPAPDASTLCSTLNPTRLHPRPAPPHSGGRRCPATLEISCRPWHARSQCGRPAVSARAATSRRSRPRPGPGSASGLAPEVLTVDSVLKVPVGAAGLGPRPLAASSLGPRPYPKGGSGAWSPGGRMGRPSGGPGGAGLCGRRGSAAGRGGRCWARDWAETTRELNRVRQLPHF